MPNAQIQIQIQIHIQIQIQIQIHEAKYEVKPVNLAASNHLEMRWQLSSIRNDVTLGDHCTVDKEICM